MASALQLTAAATLINGYGITTNPRVLSQIGQFQSQPTIALMSNIFTNASNLDSNIANVACQDNIRFLPSSALQLWCPVL